MTRRNVSSGLSAIINTCKDFIVDAAWYAKQGKAKQRPALLNAVVYDAIFVGLFLDTDHRIVHPPIRSHHPPHECMFGSALSSNLRCLIWTIFFCTKYKTRSKASSTILDSICSVAHIFFVPVHTLHLRMART